MKFRKIELAEGDSHEASSSQFLSKYLVTDDQGIVLGYVVKIRKSHAVTGGGTSGRLIVGHTQDTRWSWDTMLHDRAYKFTNSTWTREDAARRLEVK